MHEEKRDILLIDNVGKSIKGVIVVKFSSTFASIDLEFNGRIISKTGVFPFIVLKEIRKELENDKIIIFCNASRVDVYPSGMTATNLLAYLQEIGKPAVKTLNILDPPTEPEKLGTTHQQEVYRKKWMESLG